MNLLDRVKYVFKPKVFDPASSLDLQNVVGWRTLGGSSAYGYYKNHQYENGYSSISKLGNGFAQLEQYTIDGTGKAVSSNILDRLYTPNTDMSAYDFREALAVTCLVHNKVRLRVHFRTTRLTADTITGFTFMEDFSETIVGGIRHYKMSNGDDLTDETVITLKSVNPDSITDGFSPSQAAARWTTLDDYIADYQKGFFENGAIPQGQLIITARTSTEYNDIVDMLQRRHKGAGKNNNVTYTHRPTDQNGSPLNSQIEWVPFSSENKNMGLKEIFEQVNQKIDSAYGVPASIRGVNDQNTYASVRVDEVIFVKYALNPMTMKIWVKFTHELNRVTGGAGVAITYDLEIPQIADEEKVKAEARGVDAATIAALTTQGYELKTAVEYVKTGNLDILVLGKIPPKDEPDILTPEEAKNTPDQPIDAFAKSFIAMQEYFDKKFALTVVPPHITNKVLDIRDRLDFEDELGQAVKRRMKKQIESFINHYGNSKAITDDEPIEEVEDKLLTADMLAILTSLLLLQGGIEHATNVQIVAQAGINTENIKPFRLTNAQKIQYNNYVEKVATGYNDETAEKIRRVISQGRLQDLSANEIKNNLRALIDEEYRIRRISVTEINNAGTKSSLYSMQEIAEQTGAKVEKIWTHGGGDNPCAYCDALIGSSVGLDQDFVGLDQQVVGSDGSIFINDFEPRDAGGLHPNCVLPETVIKSPDAEKLLRSNYSGKVYTITTASGIRLSVTPNHILLTDRGWVRASSLRKSDSVVSDSLGVKSSLGDDHNQDSIASIGEIFGSLVKSSPMSAVKIPVSSKHFKGDGASMNKNVDIISIDSELRSEINSLFPENFNNSKLIGAGRSNGLSGDSDLSTMFIGLSLASDGILGGNGLNSMLIGSETGRKDLISFLNGTQYDTRLSETATKQVSGNPQFLSEFIKAFPGLVTLDKVTDIVDSSYTGHVYDVSSLSTVYNASGVITSNCHCGPTYKVIRS